MSSNTLSQKFSLTSSRAPFGSSFYSRLFRSHRTTQSLASSSSSASQRPAVQLRLNPPNRTEMRALESIPSISCHPRYETNDQSWCVLLNRHLGFEGLSFFAPSLVGGETLLIFFSKNNKQNRIGPNGKKINYSFRQENFSDFSPLFRPEVFFPPLRSPQTQKSRV